VDVREVRVAGKSDPTAVARSVVSALQSGQIVQLRAIGAGAVNQAVKSAAIARAYDKDSDLIMRADFAVTDDLATPLFSGSLQATLLVLTVEHGPNRITGG
jgi:stage V sporulation protein SpoVS